MHPNTKWRLLSWALHHVLQEAKYINLSLHYLEQVIVALQERSMGLPK